MCNYKKVFNIKIPFFVPRSSEINRYEMYKKLKIELIHICKQIVSKTQLEFCLISYIHAETKKNVLNINQFQYFFPAGIGVFASGCLLSHS